MPELPDIEAYVSALRERVLGATLTRISIYHPFLLRSVTPEPSEVYRRAVDSVERLGKRIVFGLTGEVSVVLHLMIAGRLAWVDSRSEGEPANGTAEQRSIGSPASGVTLARPPGGRGGAGRGGNARGAGTLCELGFSSGVVRLTEAGSKRRASLHIVRGRAALERLNPGGLEPLTSNPATFGERLRGENHTVKRALTDPHLFSGIGNAYSDEILHAAKLSPFCRTERMTEGEIARLHEATIRLLREWTERLETERAGEFPKKVTAFRPEMAVHGRFGKPCPACGTLVQRIRYAENESNYCPRCQTEGVVYADRALSRLLKGDWPRTIEELERLRAETHRA